MAPSQMLEQAVQPPSKEAIRQTVISLADAEALQGTSASSSKIECQLSSFNLGLITV